MSIEAGVQFLFAKALIYKDFPILFNESRLYGNREMVAVEPLSFYPSAPFNERSAGVCILSLEVCIYNCFFFHHYFISLIDEMFYMHILNLIMSQIAKNHV